MCLGSALQAMNIKRRWEYNINMDLGRVARMANGQTWHMTLFMLRLRWC
jgi:hypothetical protein